MLKLLFFFLVKLILSFCVTWSLARQSWLILAVCFVVGWFSRPQPTLFYSLIGSCFIQTLKPILLPFQKHSSFHHHYTLNDSKSVYKNI